MLVSSFNLSQSFNYTSYLFYKKSVQNRDQFFLYMDLGLLCYESARSTLSSNWSLKVTSLSDSSLSLGRLLVQAYKLCTYEYVYVQYIMYIVQ
jgi:hypothetical protein